MSHPHEQTQQRIMLTRPIGIVIRGLPGAGKTTLANQVALLLRASGRPVLHLSADTVRATVNSDLGFDMDSRTENARRLGAMALLAINSGITPVVDFIMPSLEAGDAFKKGIGGKEYTLWQVVRERVFKSRFADTDAIYQHSVFGEPLHYTLKDLESIAERVVQVSTSL